MLLIKIVVIKNTNSFPEMKKNFSYIFYLLRVFERPKMVAVKLAYVWLNLIKKIDILNFCVILCVLIRLNREIKLFFILNFG
jgi:hypothetical protein